ncbi:response regulator [Hamadaea tsunoensis]|uniref:response regulator n=1 Tax=Hamadaea tsunoensis TaxID=53368 RepID=UPI000486F744|nr:response regulator transcription factor [Hamadaea tsunoensis]
MTIQVLVVDDQPLIRVGLAALLRAAPGVAVCAEAASGEEAVAAATAVRPDVVLMDIRLPGISGITATERILAAYPEDPPRVIVLTTFDLDEYVLAALRAGACGFLLKDARPERLLEAITTAARGDMLFGPTVLRRLVESYAGRPGTDAVSSKEMNSLTAREVEVVRLVAKGLSNSDIAGLLDVSEATVKTHLNRVMTKLALSSRAQVVVAAYEAGLVTPARPG